MSRGALDTKFSEPRALSTPIKPFTVLQSKSHFTMFPRWTKLWTLLCVVLVIQLASAANLRMEKRQDNEDENSRTISSIAPRTSIRSEVRPTSTGKNEEQSTTTSGQSEEQTDEPKTSTASLVSVTTSIYDSSETGWNNSSSVNGMKNLELESTNIH